MATLTNEMQEAGYAKFGEPWHDMSNEQKIAALGGGATAADPGNDRWFHGKTANEGYYHPMDGGIYFSRSGDPEVLRQIQEAYPNAKPATAAQLKTLDTPDKPLLGAFGAMIEKFGDAAGPLLPFLPVLAGMAFPAAGAAGTGAGAGAGALEGAGAFGGEAFGAAANSAGAFGGSVGPWTAGVGAATGGANMDWFSNVGELPYSDPIEGLIDLTNQGLSGEQAISALSEINPAWTQTGLEFLLNNPSQIGSTGLKALKSALSGFGGGDKSGLLSTLSSLGIPAALLAGLFEDNKSPLVGPQTNAAFSALDAASKFGALEPIPMMPSSARAITVANENVGNWKPYIDEGAALTRKAAGGIPSVNLDDYMNPYMDAVMPGVRREAEKLKIAQNAAAGRVGAFGGTRMAVENSLADRNLLETTGKIRMSAFDNATGLASKDLDRMGQAGSAFTNMGSTVGKLGTGDVSNLVQAGALERQPHEDKRQKLADTARLYTGVIHGTAPAVEASTDPSKLTQAAGALGALSSLSKLGIA